MHPPLGYVINFFDIVAILIATNPITHIAFDLLFERRDFIEYFKYLIIGIWTLLRGFFNSHDKVKADHLFKPILLVN